MRIKTPARRDRGPLTEWHGWFAWYPVKIGENLWAWVEWVERRGTVRQYPSEAGGVSIAQDYWDWEYR